MPACPGPLSPSAASPPARLLAPTRLAVNGSLGFCGRHWRCPPHKHLKMSAVPAAAERCTRPGGGDHYVRCPVLVHEVTDDTVGISYQGRLLARYTRQGVLLEAPAAKQAGANGRQLEGEGAEADRAVVGDDAFMLGREHEAEVEADERHERARGVRRPHGEAAGGGRGERGGGGQGRGPPPPRPRQP